MIWGKTSFMKSHLKVIIFFFFLNIKQLYEVIPLVISIYLPSCLNWIQSLSLVQIFGFGLQHPRLPGPSPTLGDYANSCPSSRWCHPTISLPTVIPFSFHLRSFTTSGSFPMSQFLASGGQSIGASASASFCPMNIQDWFPLALTGLIPLQSKRLSKVFSNTTVHKHQFFGIQLSL